MKKVFFVLLVFSFAATVSAASSYYYIPKKATEIYMPVGANKQISLMDLSTINIKEYERLTGKHLNFFEKLSFKSSQKQLRNSIATDGTITNKKLVKSMLEPDHSTGFHIGGFALGVVLGPIGVLIAYLIKGDPAVDKNRIKWSWIGLAVFILWILLI